VVETFFQRSNKLGAGTQDAEMVFRALVALKGAFEAINTANRLK